MTTAKAAASNGVKVTPGRPKTPPKKIFPPLPPPEDDNSDDDFLKFWGDFRAEQKPATTTILGVEVEVPTDVPLMFDDVQERLAKSTADSESEEAQALFEEMCTILFGEHTYGKWKEKGLTVLMLRVLTTWGLMNAQGRPATFHEAGQIVQDAIKAEAEGKLPGPNGAARRKQASSQTRGSGSTGQPSKRISRGSTASKRAT